MTFHATLKVTTLAPQLYDCLISEAHTLDRAQVQYRLEKDVLIIEIVCKDATALRACMQTVTRLLAVFEKAAKHDHANKEHSGTSDVLS